MLNLIKQFLPFHIMRKSPLTIAEDGLITRHNFDFMRDDEFQKAYRAGRDTGSWGGADIRWRAHVAIWAAKHAARVGGDFVECGVNRGGLSRAIVEALDWENLGVRFYLLDTFEAFDPRFPPSKPQYWDYSETYSAVSETFSAFSRINIIKGAVPDTLSEVDSCRIAYLHIDMNTKIPEHEALRYFWPKMASGAVLLLDDYGFRGHEEQRAAHDMFASTQGFSILSLPTGQGLAIK